MSGAEGVDMEALKTALLKVEGNRPDNLGISTQWHRNPEGPEAWAVIEAAQSRIAQLETALAGAREVGSCELCAGKCRTHNLGDSKAWEPEEGSRAWLIAEVRKAALEEAAKVADRIASNNYSLHNHRGQQAGEQIAAAIRSLKEPPHADR